MTEVPYGMKICLWCEGDRVCWFCLGEGVRDGQRCPECLGRRDCLSCTGSGLVAQDQRTDRLPVAPNEPAPTTASTKSSRSKT